MSIATPRQADDLARQLRSFAAIGVLCTGAFALLVALLAVLGHPHGTVDAVAAVTAGVVATVVRFVLLRAWVFADRASPA